MKLRGQVAVVTGAASGIGAAIARLFMSEGAHCILADVTAPPDEMQSLDRAETIVLDVTRADDVQKVMSDTVTRHGRLDIVVNSAGILEECPFVELGVKSFDRMIEVDLRGVFLAGRFAAPHMVSQGHGRIINVASQLGIKGGVGLAHYVAAKAGVIGLTKAMALELAPHGILVNAIAPGPIETPLIASLSAEWKDAKAAELPLGRFGTAEEIAPSALLLASSPDGDLYVGQTLGPNSGDVMP